MLCPLLLILVCICPFLLSVAGQQQGLKCSAVDGEKDPALQEMQYDVGDGKQSTLVYVEPSIQSMYAPDSPIQSSTRVVPKFNGLAGKFINMSNKKLTLHWYEEVEMTVSLVLSTCLTHRGSSLPTYWNYYTLGSSQ